MSNKIVGTGQIKLNDGTWAKGPIVLHDNGEYLFRNSFSDLDLYFLLRKQNNEWSFAGGPSIQIPAEYINQIGEQIEFLLNQQ